MKRSLYLYNLIPKEYVNSQSKKKLAKKYANIISNIELKINTPNNTFHSLSKKFKLNFKFRDLYYFKKYKTIVVIGMGGSILELTQYNNFFNLK